MLNPSASIYWSELAKKLKPYVPGEQPKDKSYIKLNTNENPYPPSPRVLEAIKEAAGKDLRLYPDPECTQLRKVAGEYYGLAMEEVFIGNGSDELLTFSFQAFFDPGRIVLFPDITYSFYPAICKLCLIDYQTVPLDRDFNIPAQEFCRENGGVIIPNPNAPTGNYLPLHNIRTIVESNPNRAVIIDEAYIDFGGESAVSLIKDHSNLLVIQTLSKSRSLAGLRVGLALGSQELIAGLTRIKDSYNSYPVDRLAMAGAIAAFQDEGYFQETRGKVILTRERTSMSLKQMGFKVTDSQANFIFISHPEVKADILFGRLRETGILVRYFPSPGIDNYLRVSIGTDKDMETFIDALTEILS